MKLNVKMECDLIHMYSELPDTLQLPEKNCQTFLKEIKAVGACISLPFFAILIHDHLGSPIKLLINKDQLHCLNSISQYLPASIITL